MKQIYLDLVDGHHIKVKPIGLDTFRLVDRDYPCILVEVEESKCGFTKGERLQRQSRNLFCISGYSKVSGKIKAVAPDLSHLRQVA